MRLCLIKNQLDFDPLELGIGKLRDTNLFSFFYMWTSKFTSTICLSCSFSPVYVFGMSVEYYFITWMYLNVLTFGSLILIQCNAGLICSSNKFYYDSCNLSWYLKQFPHHSLFFLKIILVIQDVLSSHMNFRIIFLWRKSRNMVWYM